MKLRDHMMAGRGRKLFSLLFAFAAAMDCYYFWPDNQEAQKRIVDGFPKIAFVAAAFAATSYNLRTRVLDFVLKIDVSPSRTADFCRIARQCGRTLTNLVAGFLFTAIFLTMEGFVNPIGTTAVIAASVAAALSTWSVVTFVYILFSFERLERIALDESETASMKKLAGKKN